MDARRNAHALGKSLVCLLFSRGLGACLEMAARDWDWGLRARSAAAAPIQKTPGDLQMAGRLAMPSLRRCKGSEFLKPERVDFRKEQGMFAFLWRLSNGARIGADATETRRKFAGPFLMCPWLGKPACGHGSRFKAKMKIFAMKALLTIAGFLSVASAVFTSPA